MYVVIDILNDILQKDSLDIQYTMSRIITSLGTQSGLLLKLHYADKYTCMFSTGIYQSAYQVNEIFSLEELPDKRIDLFFRDSPIGCIAVDPMTSEATRLLEDVSSTIVIGLNYGRNTSDLRQLVLATSQRALDRFESISRMLMVDKIIRPSNPTESASLSSLVAILGNSVQELREVRDWAQLTITPKTLLWQSTVLYNFLTATRTMLHQNFTFAIDSNVPETVFLDQLLFRRSLLYPILRSYSESQQQMIRLDIKIQESGINSGFLILHVQNAPVPRSVTELSNSFDPLAISISLARDICFMTGGFIKTNGDNELIFTVPIHFTDIVLTGYQIVLDLENRAVRETLFDEMLQMSASVSLYSEEQRQLLFGITRQRTSRVIITDPRSTNLNFYLQIPNVNIIVVTDKEFVPIGTRRWDGVSKRELLKLIIR